MSNEMAKRVIRNGTLKGGAAATGMARGAALGGPLGAILGATAGDLEKKAEK